MPKKPKLISFNLCPYVQRSVILLEEKQVDYDIEFIHVYEPPAWFLEISPTGKVPVLQVGDEVLFESTVIAEYIEEVYAPPLHPSDALQKAKNRAWMEYTNALYGGAFNLMMAKTQKSAEKHVQNLQDTQKNLNEMKQNQPWFNGSAFSLIDVYAAPYFVRTAFFKDNFGIDILKDAPKLQDWAEKLLARPSVQNSVVEGFKQIMLDEMAEHNSYLLK